MIWKSSLPLSLKLESTFHLTNNIAYIFMIFPALLTFPALFLLFHLKSTYILFVYIFLFFSATVSVWIFYLCSQKETYGNWWGSLKYLILLMPLAIGLSINNAKAVCEALLNYQTEFVRTPKFGARLPGYTLQNSAYKSSQKTVIFLEGFLSLYFTVALIYAIFHKIYLIIPLLLIFQVGFLSVLILSLTHWRKYSALKISWA